MKKTNNKEEEKSIELVNADINNRIFYCLHKEKIDKRYRSND